MTYKYHKVEHKVHRLIPSRFPPVSLFDWAQSASELEQIAALEGLTNERLQAEYGVINLVAPEDWISGDGSTPLMAAFTHPGISRFSDGCYGIYYASNDLLTAIAETRFHRMKFLQASQEPPCLIQMREYIAKVKKPLVTLPTAQHKKLLHPEHWIDSQAFGWEVKQNKEWGIFYPSVRYRGGFCVAILRPPALTIPTQGCHLDYIWDGQCIEARKSEPVAIA